MIVGLAQELLALEHDGEDVAGVFGVVLVLIDEAAKDFLGAEFFRGIFLILAAGRRVGGAPEGKWRIAVFLMGLPAVHAEVAAEVAAGLGIGEKCGDDGLALDEGALGGGALAAAGTDMPGFCKSHGEMNSVGDG